MYTIFIFITNLKEKKNDQWLRFHRSVLNKKIDRRLIWRIIFIITRVSLIKLKKITDPHFPFFYIFPTYFSTLERSTVKKNVTHWSNQVYNTIEESIRGKNIRYIASSGTRFLQSFTNDAYASTVTIEAPYFAVT